MGSHTTGNDDVASADVLGLITGAGIILMQAAAVIPGLLPVLILLLPAVLPLVVLGLVAGIIVGIPYGVWRLCLLALRPLIRHGGASSDGRPAAAGPGDASLVTSGRMRPAGHDGWAAFARPAATNDGVAPGGGRPSP